MGASGRSFTPLPQEWLASKAHICYTKQIVTLAGMQLMRIRDISFASLLLAASCLNTAWGQASDVDIRSSGTETPVAEDGADFAKGIQNEVESLLVIEDGPEASSARYDAAQRWVERDPMAAFEAIAQVPASRERDELEGMLIDRWMAFDTASALRYLAALDELPDYLRRSAPGPSENVSGWLPMSADSDWLEIIEIADSLPVELRRYVRVQAIRRIANDDPRAAAELVRDLPADDRAQASLSIYRKYVELDADEALRWARELEVPNLESMVVETMAARDPFDMLERARSDPNPMMLAWVAAGAANSQGLDRAAFGSLLAQMPRTPVTAAALESFAQSWLVYDEKAMLEWLAVSKPDLPVVIVDRAAQRTGSDPQFAAEFAARLQGRARSAWIESIGRSLTRRDPVMALEWLDQFRSDPVYQSMVAGIAPDLAGVDGPRAARLVELLEGRDRQGASWSVARRWADNDPLAAIRWADGLPEDTRAPSIRAAVDQWHSYAPEAAQNWVRSLPSGFIQDEALKALDAAEAAAARLRELRQSVPQQSVQYDDASMQKTLFAAFRNMARNNDAMALEMLGMLSDPDLKALAKQMLDRPNDAALQKRADEILAPEPGREYGMFGPIRPVAPQD